MGLNLPVNPQIREKACPIVVNSFQRHPESPPHGPLTLFQYLPESIYRPHNAPQNSSHGESAPDSSAALNSLRKNQIFVIPRRAARRGISLFLGLNQRGIPHFVRNDKINYFFRSRLPHAFFACLRDKPLPEAAAHPGMR
jgi:hypothetical protein